MGDILFKMFMAGFATFFKFTAMVFVASWFATELPKTKNKFLRFVKGVGIAVLISAFISFPRPSSDDDYYDDSPPKSTKEQMEDFYKNFGSSLVVILFGSRVFVYFTEEYMKRKREEDQINS